MTANETPNEQSTFDALSTDQMLLVNRYCDQFEQQWRTSKAASLRDFVNGIEPLAADSDAVLHLELTAIDIQCRRQFGQKVLVDDYRELFPSLKNLDLPELAGDAISWKSSQAILNEGQRIGDYVIQACIGQGGMGQVYRARHELMGRDVAIKVLLESTRNDEVAQRRFEREVRSVAKMSHPNVVTAFDAREANGMLCLVTEWIDGSTLSELVRADGPLPADEAIQCAVQAAQGLEYAHAMGFIHRDVKPGNLLLENDGNVKVLDLGLAKLRMDLDGDQSEDAITQTNQVLGTAQFLSPEQARSPGQADVRSDIYSLGCSLFYFLSGKPPYLGDTPLDTMLSHVSSATPNVSDVAETKTIPRRLSDFVALMMAKQPSDRPESMAAVIAELQSIRSELGDQDSLSAEALKPVSALPSDANKPGRLLRKWAVAAVVVLFFVIGWQILKPAGLDSPSTIYKPDAASVIFDGESAYADVSGFDVPFSDSATIEVMVTPDRTPLPANVLTWSGENILVLFAGPNRRWGIAYRHSGQSHLEVADESFVNNQTYLLAAHWDGSKAQLWIDGKLVSTTHSSYPLVASENALCFGGVPPGLLPMDQGTRFFRGKIHKIRVSQTQLTVPAKDESELVLHDGCVALFNLEEANESRVIDSSANKWTADLHNVMWEVHPRGTDSQ